MNRKFEIVASERMTSDKEMNSKYRGETGTAFAEYGYNYIRASEKR